MTAFTCRTVAYGSPAYHQTVDLRDRILRQPLGLAFTPEQLAAEKDDLHLTIWSAHTLAGCLVLTPQPAQTVKMRQVAIDPTYQGQGIGTMLVQYSEDVARKQGYTTMCCHARESAVSFYKKLGYTVKGDVFTEVTLPHYYMEKPL